MFKLTIGLLTFMLSASAGATQMELQYINKADITTTQVEVCASVGNGLPMCQQVSSTCDPEDTCSVIADLPHGLTTVSIKVLGNDMWSLSSNLIDKVVIDPVECMLSVGCRMDIDGSGNVTVSDFGKFYSVFGTSWITQP